MGIVILGVRFRNRRLCVFPFSLKSSDRVLSFFESDILGLTDARFLPVFRHHVLRCQCRDRIRVLESLDRLFVQDGRGDL